MAAETNFLKLTGRVGSNPTSCITFQCTRGGIVTFQCTRGGIGRRIAAAMSGKNKQ